MVEPSNDLQLVFEKAIDIAKKLQHEYLTIEHLLFSMLCDESFSNCVHGYGADPDYIKKNLEHYLKNKLNDIVTTEENVKPKINLTPKTTIKLKNANVNVVAEPKTNVNVKTNPLISETKSKPMRITAIEKPLPATVVKPSPLIDAKPEPLSAKVKPSIRPRPKTVESVKPEVKPKNNASAKNNQNNKNKNKNKNKAEPEQAAPTALRKTPKLVPRGIRKTTAS